MKVTGEFFTVERANEAMAKLKNAGFTNVHIEIDDSNKTIKRNLANSTSGYGLSKLTIDPNEMKQNPLTSVSPLINVTGGFSEYSDSNYKLVAETDPSLIPKAEELIKSLGGKFEPEREDIGRVHESVGELNNKFKNNEI